MVKRVKKVTKKRVSERIRLGKPRRKALRERSISVVPEALRPGRIIVHNHVLPSLTLGLRGFNQ
jgi:hypothetical protein